LALQIPGVPLVLANGKTIHVISTRPNKKLLNQAYGRWGKMLQSKLLGLSQNKSKVTIGLRSYEQLN
jgi:hypothetical protein